MTLMFAVVVFLSAFLLFQVQLIVAKHLLPWFGGTPAVWTTSQMFFQLLLLAGYAYAHVLTTAHHASRQFRVHVVVLAAAVAAVFALPLWGGQPLLAPAAMRPDGEENPVVLLLLILTVSVGLPFFAVATTGPLLQRWHSRQSASIGRTYRLYALSNAGSFLGLLSYPFGVERVLDLPQQAWLWSGLFASFAAGCAVIAWRAASVGDTAASGATQAGGEGAGVPEHEPSHARPARALTWLLLTFMSSVMFLATTNQLSQDVAPVPFLWVLPLSIYLLTFIICFDRPAWYSRRWAMAAAALTSIGVVPMVAIGLDVPIQVLAYGAFLFSVCLLYHGELVRLRPGPRQLTFFYLVVASGGALGGTFVSIVAPLVFPDLWEFQAAVLAGWLVIGFIWWVDRDSPLHTGDRWLFVTIVVIAAWFAIRFLIEATRVGRIEWVSDYGWPVTLAGVAVSAVCVCGIVWRSSLARTSLWPQALLLVLVLGSGLFLAQRIAMTRSGLLHAARNFYGVIRVVAGDVPGGAVRQLLHGTTTHGIQVNVPGLSSRPTAYYSPSSGVALAAKALVRRPHQSSAAPDGRHFGIVGMGIGTMSAYARAGDQVRYYEINPAVIDLVQGSRPFFTFVTDSPAVVTTVAGDARLALERELAAGGSQQFDLLVMDAFSSDSVPVHLVTTEAFRLYAAHLRSDESILAVNVTNRHIDLEPVIAAHARELGFHAVRVDTSGDQPLPTGSSWIVMSRDVGILTERAIVDAGGRPLLGRAVRFTDNYSNLFRVLK